MKIVWLPRVDFRKKSTIAAIVFWLIIFILALAVYNYGRSNNFGFDALIGDNRQEVGSSTSGSYGYTHSIEDIYEIDLRWQSGHITVRPISGDEIRISESSARELDHSSRLTMDGEEGTLLIKWDEQTGPKEALRGRYDKNLLLEIPKDMELELLKISSVSGEIQLEGVEGYELKLTADAADISLTDCLADSISAVTGSGDISLNETDANSMKLITTSGPISGRDSISHSLRLDSVSGEISFGGSFQKLTAASTSGNLTLETDVLPTQLRVGSVSGEVKLTIPEDSYLPVTASSVSGKFESDFKELEDMKAYEPEDGEEDGEEEEKFLTVTTTSGNACLIKGDRSHDPAELFPEESEGE